MSDGVSSCPFCDRVSRGAFTSERELAVAFPDGFPVSPGHTLVVPRRHVADLFTLDREELAAVCQLVGDIRSLMLDAGDAAPPDGFNIGVNNGAAAGQTVEHAHVHVIPRYAGDTADPRGGIRKVIPDRARYWR